MQTVSNDWYIQLQILISFLDNCLVKLKFLFFETCTQPFCKRYYPVIVITKTRHVLCTGKCTRLYILEIIKAWPLCILWTRGHTCISLLSYIKSKRLDNDIKNKKHFKNLHKLWNLRKTKKKCHIGVSNPNNLNSVCMERNSSTPIPLGHSAVDIRSGITCTVQVNRTSWLRQNNDEKFGKITKICLLETK